MIHNNEPNIFLDHRCHEISVGDLVVYNYSGEVAMGEVIERTTIHRYGRARPRFKIKQTIPRSGHISTVMNAKNLMAVNEIKML